MENELKIRQVLSEAAPRHAAALLVREAARLLFEADRILTLGAFKAGRGCDDGDKTEADRLFALRDLGNRIEYKADRLEDRLLRPSSVDDRIDELVERFSCYADRPGFRMAVDALVDFLSGELGDDADWPIAVFCPDGESSWAFAVLPFDDTGYVKPPCPNEDPEAWDIEWYGTTWEPGCECGEALPDGSGLLGADDEHRDGCPAKGGSSGE